MDILEYVEKAVKQGKNCHVDFKTNTICVGREKVMKEGETKYDIDFAKCDDPMGELQRLFEVYKYSMPSAREEKKRRGYFRALDMDDIPDDRLVNAVERSIARARLEVWFLCSKLSGCLTWNPEWGSFFWQSEQYPELIVLKEWLL